MPSPEADLLAALAAALAHALAPPLARLFETVAGVGLLSLFSRIGQESLLENPVRQQLHEAIQQDPGLCMGALRERTGVAWGTAVYHLHRLERTGLVVSLRQGGFRRYFSPNATSRHRSHIAVLSHPTAQRIAAFVHAHPGAGQAAVCRALGLLSPSASKHLGRLESLGLVVAERAGRSRLYQPTPELAGALAILEAGAAQP